MSGPKSSVYTLTAEQRRILAAKRETELRRIAEEKRLAELRRQEEERRRKEEQKTKTQSISSSDLCLARISKLLSSSSVVGLQSEDVWKRIGDDGGWATSFDKLRKIEIRATEVKQKISIDMELTSLINAQRELESLDAEATKIGTTLSGISEYNEKRFNESAFNDIDRGFRKKASLSIRQECEKLLVKIKESNLAIQAENRKRLEELKSYCLPKTLLEDIDKCILLLDSMDVSMSQDFQALHVAPIEKRCAAFIDEQKKLREKFSEMYPVYFALCNKCEIEPEEYSATQVGVDSLLSKVEELEALCQEEDEQIYISKCIDETMREMGYSVLGHRDIEKKSGKKIHHELYNYDDSTAVNVSYSSDGQITMELGAIDTVDRLPTVTEASSLCGQMESFCNDFTEFEKRLLAKGVVAKNRIAMLPPSSEYAQVLNISDYDVERNTRESGMKGQISQRRLKHISAEE